MRCKLIVLAACWATAATAMLSVAGPGAAQAHRGAGYPYRLIDLGTLGGPNDGIGNFPPASLNAAGVVTGTANTSVADPYSPDNSAFNGDPFVQHTFLWHDGVLRDLGALGAQAGRNSSYPNAINSRGDAAGLSDNGIIDPGLGVPEADAVLCKDGHIINLGTLGGNQSQAFALNTAIRSSELRRTRLPTRSRC
jgi:hypothetical protein